MTTTPLAINEFDKAHLAYRLAGCGSQFATQFDYMMSCPASEKAYLLKGPDWMTWVRHVEPPEFDAPDSAWVVFYLSLSSSLTLLDMFSFFPYQLPYIGFARGIRGRHTIRFHEFDRLHRKCKVSL